MDLNEVHLHYEVEAIPESNSLTHPRLTVYEPHTPMRTLNGPQKKWRLPKQLYGIYLTRLSKSQHHRQKY